MNKRRKYVLIGKKLVGGTYLIPTRYWQDFVEDFWANSNTEAREKAKQHDGIKLELFAKIPLR